MAGATQCPKCGNQLLWNGRGMACISCTYVSADRRSPSDPKLPSVRRRRKGDAKK